MIRTVIATLALVLASAAGLQGAAAQQQASVTPQQLWGPGTTIRVATEGAYKPWNYRADNGQLVGFEIDLVRQLCDDLNYNCRLQSESWSRMLPSLNEDKFDVVFAGMSITKSRLRQAAFSVPYAATPAVFVTRRGEVSLDPDIDHVSLSRIDEDEETFVRNLRKAFLNKPIGVQSGTTHEYFLRFYLEGYALLRTYESQEELDADVKAGELTAMLASLGYAAPLVQSPRGRDLAIVGPRLSGGPFGPGIAAAVKTGNEALANAFSDAIRRRLQDGTIGKLAVKWFGFDVSSKMAP